MILLGIVFYSGGILFDSPDRTWGPAAGVMVLVVFIGESIREAFDPKQYAKYE